MRPLLGFRSGAGGGGGGGGGGGFDPLSQSPDGRWAASYSGAPWVAAAGGNLTVDADADATPVTGSAVNGLTPANFVAATGEALETTTNATNYITTAAGTILMLVRLSSAAATAGVFNDPAMIVCRTNNVMITYSTSGIQAGIFDGAQKSATVALATGVYALVCMRWNSTTLTLDVMRSGTTTATAACGATSSLAGKLLLGKQPGISWANFSALEVETFKRKITDVERDAFLAYCQTTYPSAGL